MAGKGLVVGVDVGASSTLVAFVGRGQVDFVQNEVSSRKTPTLVGFEDQKRLLGDASLSRIRSNLKSTCRNFYHLIGRSIDDPVVEFERKYELAPIVEKDGKAAFQVQFDGKKQIFMPEQIVAMFITKLRTISEKWCNQPMNDLVLAIPASLKDQQRKALLDACHIAGVSCLALMHEHTACALAYGIYRSNEFPDPGEKPQNVMFINIGHAHANIFICAFRKGSLEVLSQCDSNEVCGRVLDDILIKYFAAEFQKKHKSDPMENKKAKYKLEEAVDKTKATLSINSEAPVSIECLMDDYDFGGRVDRKEFEEHGAPLQPKLRALLEKCITQSGLSTDDLHSVEISGGSARVAWVKEVITTVTGKPCMSTMNMDECVARGAALYGAMLSPMYRVREFKIVDKCQHPISIVATGGEEAPSLCPFLKAETHQLVAEEAQYFRKAPFHIELHYDKPTKGTPGLVGNWTVNLPPCEEAKQCSVRGRVDVHGCAELTGVEVYEEEEYDDTVMEKEEIPMEEILAQEAAQKAAEAQAEAERLLEQGVIQPPLLQGAAETTPDAPPAAPEAPPAASPDPSQAEAPAAPAEPVPPAAAPEGAEASAPEGGAPAGAPEDGAAAEGAAAVAAMLAEEERLKNEEVVRTRDAKPVEPKKQYRWVEKVERKTRWKSTALGLTQTGRTLGLAQPEKDRFRNEELRLQEDMAEIEKMEIAKNDLESYIFTMRDRVQPNGELGKFIRPADREPFLAALNKTEEWTYDAEEECEWDRVKLLRAYTGKVAELEQVGGPVQARFKEADKLKDELQEAEKTFVKYRDRVHLPEYKHMEKKDREAMVGGVEQAENWLAAAKLQHSSLPEYEDSALKSGDVIAKCKELDDLAEKHFPEPRKAPAPPPVRKSPEPDEDDDDVAKGDMEGDLPEPSPTKRPADGEESASKRPKHEEADAKDDTTLEVD